MDKAMLLEICKKNAKGSFEATQEAASEKAEVLAKAVKEKFRHAALVKTPAVLVCANRGLPIYAQVDDMAQMIGRKIPVVSDETGRVLKALERRNAVLCGYRRRCRPKPKMIRQRLGCSWTNASAVYILRLRRKAEAALRHGFNELVYKKVFKARTGEEIGLTLKERGEK